jgi:hypothetical protein
MQYHVALILLPRPQSLEFLLGAARSSAARRACSAASGVADILQFLLAH